MKNDWNTFLQKTFRKEIFFAEWVVPQLDI